MSMGIMQKDFMVSSIFVSAGSGTLLGAKALPGG
jgi:hypothetical protein